MSELVDDQAAKWRMSITHDCKSVFVIDKDDIMHKYIEGSDSGSHCYWAICPACRLEHPISYQDLPSWVVRYASRNGRK